MFFLCAGILALFITVLYFFVKNSKPINQNKDMNMEKETKPYEITITITTSAEKHDPEEDIKQSILIENIRKEIKDSVQNHNVAVRTLMALARIDGVTSKAERRIVFSFLQMQGESLNDDRHWPHFHSYQADEWHRAISPDEIIDLCRPLKTMPQNYRIAIASAAQAIVATGAAPKKSEQIALQKIIEILHE